MNFATLKGLTIPVDKATVTIKGSGDSNLLYVMVDGVKYTSAATLKVPKGTTVYCCADADYDLGSPEIRFNDKVVNEGGIYEYAINGNATIEMYLDGGTNGYYGDMQITETPLSGVVTQIADASGRVLWSAMKKAIVTITANAHTSNSPTVTVNGQTYTREGITNADNTYETLEIPVEVGTVINCTMSYSRFVRSQILVNGEVVQDSVVVKAQLEYNYVVQGNVTVLFTNQIQSGGAPFQQISITDE